ncbi:SDR family oxidoreductase [Catenuloplanes japonicus]|uniref:SDR family oxidoreductase n=1 Tax=Catenuloplanes japonicus TaxID=33876 RepID=UPI00052605C8|nr:SDR family oxidoreductase [Catenuloplanes japonicus]
MRVFVTGASGWNGRHLVAELLGAGHQVVGLARSDASATFVAGLGADVLRGGLDDLDSLRAGADAADAVAHLAFIHDDFTRMDLAIEADARAVAAIGEVLAGTGKPLVTTGGTPALGGRTAVESDWSPLGNPGTGPGRDANARAALALADRGVRSSVLRLPPTVHGTGDHGFIAALVGLARQQGVAGYVGDGSARWAAVHVKDAARLYRLALEHASAGTVLHGIGDGGVPGREIAAAIGRGLDLPVASVPAESLGFFGMMLSLDYAAAAPRTRELLDWKPEHPGLIEDLDLGHYFGR